ncbi:MAG: RnfABCDGE type electron transport complex subunit G [Thermodesulfobacteriota bacterium]|nr:RnfABCDGE type electron transport complex subunit G [Thermodesulfobacteriota bacterium]
MRDIIKMIVVLGLIAGVAGALLAGVRMGTMEKIEYQELKYVKGPVIMKILKGCTNNPIKDRFKLKYGEEEINFFPAVFDGKLDVVAFETTGGGFGGDIGIVMAVNLEKDTLTGIGITTHKETPGVGTLVKDSESFKNSVKGLSVNQPIKVKNDGGKVDAVTGATVTSRGVCEGATRGSEIYRKLKNDILAKAKDIK